VISRFLVIVLAFGAAAYQASRGALVESLGLACLGAGLLVLRWSERRPGLRQIAWLAFALTAVAVVLAALRLR
jgi:hypothetical protein